MMPRQTSRKPWEKRRRLARLDSERKEIVCAIETTASVDASSFFSQLFYSYTAFYLSANESTTANMETEEALESLSRRRRSLTIRDSETDRFSSSFLSFISLTRHGAFRRHDCTHQRANWRILDSSEHLVQSSNFQMFYGDDLTCASKDSTRLLSNRLSFEKFE